MSNYSVTWDEEIPARTKARSLGDERIRQLKVHIRERLAEEHELLRGPSSRNRGLTLKNQAFLRLKLKNIPNCLTETAACFRFHNRGFHIEV